MRLSRLPHAVLLILGLWAVPVAAAERIVVLELGNPAALKVQETMYLTDQVRGVVGEQVSGTYLVLTRENLLELLPPGTDLASCVGDCEVESGRRVGADHVVSGEIVHFGEELRISLHLHDTRSGRLQGMETASAKRVAELEAPLREAARRLSRRLGAPPPESGARPMLKAGFGPAAEIPPIPVLPDRLLPPAEGITDVALLEKIQAVRRAESEIPISEPRVAAAWQALGDHPSPNPLRETAGSRAAEWTRVAKAMEDRDALLAAVRQRHTEDRDKLKRLLALDGDLVSSAQKAAYADEFHWVWSSLESKRELTLHNTTKPQAAPSSQTGTPKSVLRPVPGTRSRGVNVPPLVVMGAGAVLVVVGLATASVGEFQNNDFDLKNCRRNADEKEIFRCTPSEYKVAEEEAHAGDDTIDKGWTVTGIGAAVAVIGGVWFLAQPKKPAIGAAVGPGGLTIYGAF